MYSRLKSLVKDPDAVGGEDQDAGVVLQYSQKDCIISAASYRSLVLLNLPETSPFRFMSSALCSYQHLLEWSPIRKQWHFILHCALSRRHLPRQ